MSKNIPFTMRLIVQLMDVESEEETESIVFDVYTKDLAGVRNFVGDEFYEDSGPLSTTLIGAIYDAIETRYDGKLMVTNNSVGMECIQDFEAAADLMIHWHCDCTNIDEHRTACYDNYELEIVRLDDDDDDLNDNIDQ